MSTRRKRFPSLFVSLFIAFMGVAALGNAARNPHFAGLRAVDVVQLLAAGMCFGAAVVGFVMVFRGRDSD